MQNNKLILCLLIASFILGFLICNTCCNGHSQRICHSREGGNPITVLDTIRISSISYKYIPGITYNIDSLTTSINQFWKDSLKTLYGKGLFQSHYSKSDDLGKRDYTLSSRIPIDPESQLIIDESFTFPKRTLSIIAGLSSQLNCSLGLKYYFPDHRKYSLTGSAAGEYQFINKSWSPNVRLELEYMF